MYEEHILLGQCCKMQFAVLKCVKNNNSVSLYIRNFSSLQKLRKFASSIKQKMLPFIGNSIYTLFKICNYYYRVITE